MKYPVACKMAIRKKAEEILLKKVNWVLVLLVLIGFVIGRFIGTYFSGSFLNYGPKQSAGTGSWLYHSDLRTENPYYHSQCAGGSDFSADLSFYPLSASGIGEGPKGAYEKETNDGCAGQAL